MYGIGLRIRVSYTSHNNGSLDTAPRRSREFKKCGISRQGTRGGDSSDGEGTIEINGKRAGAAALSPFSRGCHFSFPSPLYPFFFSFRMSSAVRLSFRARRLHSFSSRARALLRVPSLASRSSFVRKLPLK